MKGNFLVTLALSLFIIDAYGQVTRLTCTHDDGRVEQLTVDDGRQTLRWGSYQEYNLEETRGYTFDEVGRKIPAKAFVYEDRVMRGGWTELIVTNQGIRFVKGPIGNPDPRWWQKGSCRRR